MTRSLEERLDALERKLMALEEGDKQLALSFAQLLEAVGSDVLREVLRNLQDRDAKKNRSSSTTRDMTVDDARRVLSGDLRELGHKEAGERIGLTYAQVYSCRLAYTFKHVHKELRDGGWKSPWEKSRR